MMTTLQSKDCQNDLNLSFPIVVESPPFQLPVDNSMQIVFTGFYNGYNVEVHSPEETTLLHHMGCFGKGSASRSQPKSVQNHNSAQIMRKRQFLKRNYWFKKFGVPNKTPEADAFLKEIGEITSKIISDSAKSSNKDIIDLVSSDEDNDELSNLPQDLLIDQSQNSMHDTENIAVIVPNSDSEEEDYFANMKPKCCLNKVKVPEKLMLTLQEAFFLLYGLGCLQIVNIDNTLLNVDRCWELFTASDQNFISKYVVFHYYKSKGYVVKPGIKFGGDYLIYKEGPAINHSDYIVVIKSRVKVMDWIAVLGHMRMANTTVKEILIAEVIEPEDIIEISPRRLKDYSIREILLSRTLPVIINEDDYLVFYLNNYIYTTFNNIII